MTGSGAARNLDVYEVAFLAGGVQRARERVDYDARRAVGGAAAIGFLDGAV